LLTRLGADIVECCFLAELKELGGRTTLRGQKIYSLIKYRE